jgi:hypothetical protein
MASSSDCSGFVTAAAVYLLLGWLPVQQTQPEPAMSLLANADGPKLGFIGLLRLVTLLATEVVW